MPTCPHLQNEMSALLDKVFVMIKWNTVFESWSRMPGHLYTFNNFFFIVVVYPQCFRGCSGISSWKVSPSDSARWCPDTLMDLSSPRTHFSVWIPLSFGPPLLSTWILPPWRRDMEFVVNWQGSFFFFFFLLLGVSFVCLRAMFPSESCPASPSQKKLYACANRNDSVLCHLLLYYLETD